MGKWIYLDSGARSGQENMQLDEWLARHWYTETRRPVFRLYAWNPFAISLGYHQAIEDINRAAANSAGYDVVHRPTGGRAVLHANEITYSIVLDATDKSVNDIYAHVSRVLVSGLRKAGFDVTFAGYNSEFSKKYRDKSNTTCFSISSEYEIQHNGRKLVGSAQRRYHRPDGGITALQHGSILTGPEHYRLTDFLRINESRKQRMKKLLQDSSTDLSQSRSAPIDEPQLKKIIKETAMLDLSDNVYEERDHAFFISQMKTFQLNPEHV